LAQGRINVRTQFHWNRHCERSAAIPLGQGALLRDRRGCYGVEIATAQAPRNDNLLKRLAMTFSPQV